MNAETADYLAKARAHLPTPRKIAALRLPDIAAREAATPPYASMTRRSRRLPSLATEE